MAEDDDDSFGDFTFAPSNPTVDSINGRDSSNDDDDDWGDFINSGGLPRALSLSKISNPQPFSSDQPCSAPSRVNSGVNQWEKPKGALPLSIFGDLEDQDHVEENSGADPSFGYGGASLFSSKNADSAKKGSALYVDDLIVNLYKQNDPINRLDSVEKFFKNEKNSNITNSGWNWMSPGTIGLNGNNKNELKLNYQGLNLDWDPLKLNPNALNSNIDGTNSVMEEEKPIENRSDSGLVDGAQPITQMVDELSEMNQNKNENGTVSNLNGFNSSWDALSLDFNGWSSKVRSTNSGTNSLNLDLVDENREVVDDDDNGWEFKVANPKPLVGDDKVGQINNELFPISNFKGTSSSWDKLYSDSSGLNPSNVKSIEKQFGSSLIDEMKYSEDTDGWAFKAAEPELQGDGRMAENFKGDLNSFGFGKGVRGEFDFNTGYKSKQNEIENRTGCSSVLGKVGSDENSWAFKDPFVEAESMDKGKPKVAEVSLTVEASELNDKVQGNKVRVDNHKEALPLSIFGDEEKEADDPVIYQDISTQMSTTDKKDGTKGPHLNISINDLISSLYSQAEPSTSVNHEHNLSENALDSTKTVMGSDLANANPDFDDDSWEFQDASSEAQPYDQISVSGLGESHTNYSTNTDLISRLYSQTEQNSSVNHKQNRSEDGLHSTKNVMGCKCANANPDFDDDSWEFQDTSSGDRAEDQVSVLGLGESHTKYSNNPEPNGYVEFFSKLEEELHCVVLCHLENLKKAQSAASLIGDDSKVQALDKEIQGLNNELHQYSIIPGEIHSENRSSGNICLNLFVEVLPEPKYQVFESEFQLTKKLSLVESDWRSAVELLKYVALTHKVLTTVSVEDQSNYVSVWSKMLSACAQELRHGALIWKQALQENVQDQILSKSQGKKYVLALGEIYRVVEVLGSSAKLYKPWILASSTDPVRIFTYIRECSSLWSSSGLEEALQSILSSADTEYDGSFNTLSESIQYIRSLDVHTLYNNVFTGQGPTCQLSALTVGTVPGMKTVVWNGKNCFLSLANLWANLVSSDPPNLPCIHDG